MSGYDYRLLLGIAVDRRCDWLFALVGAASDVSFLEGFCRYLIDLEDGEHDLAVQDQTLLLAAVAARIEYLRARKVPEAFLRAFPVEDEP